MPRLQAAIRIAASRSCACEYEYDLLVQVARDGWATCTFPQGLFVNTAAADYVLPLVYRYTPNSKIHCEEQPMFPTFAIVTYLVLCCIREDSSAPECTYEYVFMLQVLHFLRTLLLSSFWASRGHRVSSLLPPRFLPTIFIAQK